jgi:hypothetical protein
MEIKSSKDYHQTQKGKKEEAIHTHIEDAQRLVTEEVEMLQIVLYLVMRKRSKVVGS